MPIRNPHPPSSLFFLLPRLGVGLLFATGTAAWAVFGETRTITSETPIPANWVILGQINPYAPWLGAVPDEQTRIIMDTQGAPHGTVLRIHADSPIPDGWYLLRRRRGVLLDDQTLVIRNQNDPPPEGGTGEPSA